MKHIIDNSGFEYWFNDKNYHYRVDGGPIYISNLGSEYWEENGESHRENGPAVIYSNGKEIWYKNGKRIK